MSSKLDFFDNTTQFQEHAPGVEASLRFETLYPSYLTAKKKIIETITLPVWNTLKAISDPNDAILIMRSAIANYTMYRHAIFWSTSKNNTPQKLYKYQLEDMKEEYITMFWAAMDDLFSYLDLHPTLGEWNQSPYSKQRENLVVKSASDFNFYFAIDDSPYFYSKVLFLLRKITADNIRPRVGDLTKLTDDDFGQKVKRALCYHVMAQAVQLFDITELPKSIRNDITHEFTKSGSQVQVREKLHAALMADVNKYYSDIERDNALKAGNTQTVVNLNKESDKFYGML